MFQIVAKLLNEAEAKQTLEYIDERASRGLRALAVANSPDGDKDWALIGLISLLDPPRDDSAATIKEAQALGVEVKMITGEHPCKTIAPQLKLVSYVRAVHQIAELQWFT